MGLLRTINYVSVYKMCHVALRVMAMSSIGQSLFIIFLSFLVSIVVLLIQNIASVYKSINLLAGSAHVARRAHL